MMVLIDKGLLPNLYVECDSIQWAEMYHVIFILKDHYCLFCRYLVNKGK